MRWTKKFVYRIQGCKSPPTGLVVDSQQQWLKPLQIPAASSQKDHVLSLDDSEKVATFNPLYYDLDQKVFDRRALEKYGKKIISKCWSLNYRKDGSGLPSWLINLEKQRRSKMCSMSYLLVVWWPWNFTFINGFLSKHIRSQLLGVLDH